MRNDRLIAIIGLSTLESAGLRNLLDGEWNGKIATFQSLEEMIPMENSIDAFFVSSPVFAGCIDYFMPRRQKTVIIVRRDLNKADSSPITLSSYADETFLKEKINSFIGGITQPDILPGELSPREKEVLRYIAEGKLNKEIADLLCISVNTVITHRKNISSKLGIKSASGLSLYAMMNGYI